VIRSKAILDVEGRIIRFEAEGHADRGSRGQDITCAAFTVLARTAYECLASLPGVEADGIAPEPGVLRFGVRRYGEGCVERAAGIADFLLAGISGLEREFPGAVELSIDRFWRE